MCTLKHEHTFCCFFFLLICSAMYSLFFFLNDTPTPEIYPLPLHDALPICIQNPPAGLIPDARGRKPGAELGFTRPSARAPADAYSLDLAGGRVTRWTESETAGLNTGDFAAAELVHWPSFDARAISGFLYKPPARFAGRRPVIINIHGGPEGQSRPGFLGRNNFYLN